MPARIIDGRALAASIRSTVAERVAVYTTAAGRRPQLVSVLVGDEPVSESYAKAKRSAAAKAGIDYRIERLAASSNTPDIVGAIVALSTDPGVDAIMVEMPLPKGVDERAVIEAIDPKKDADGVTPSSLGRLTSGLAGPRPATALAVMALLDSDGTQLAGASAIVIGRSRTVGLPAALMLIERNATVSIAHSRTLEIAAETKRADIIVAAAGVPGLVRGTAIKPGAIVIDVGTTWVEGADGGRMVGDVVADEAAIVAGALTPVPGGVGPVTTAIVLRTAIELAEASRDENAV